MPKSVDAVTAFSSLFILAYAAHLTQQQSKWKADSNIFFLEERGRHCWDI